MRIVLCINLLSQLCLSPRLWGYGTRYFPKVSLLQDTSVDFNFLLLFLPCLFLMSFGRFHQWFLYLFLGVMAVAVAVDINRLQVWIWQQILMILFGFVLLQKHKNVTYLQWIFIAIYLWSGIHKLNPLFAENTFKWFLEETIFQSFGRLPMLGYASACIEILIALLLVFPYTRRIGCILSFIFHAFILYCIGPFGHDWNTVVWPWNVAMIFWIYLLFYKNKNTLIIANQSIREKIIAFVLIILVFINPFFHYFNAWDEQLSFKMYAGDCMEGTLYLEPRDNELLPEYILSEIYVPAQDSLSDKIRVVLDDWAFAELHVPPYYNDFSIKKIVNFYCKKAKFQDKCGIELLNYNAFEHNKEVIKIYKCEQ